MPTVCSTYRKPGGSLPLHSESRLECSGFVEDKMQYMNARIDRPPFAWSVLVLSKGLNQSRIALEVASLEVGIVA